MAIGLSAGQNPQVSTEQGGLSLPMLQPIRSESFLQDTLQFLLTTAHRQVASFFLDRRHGAKRPNGARCAGVEAERERGARSGGEAGQLGRCSICPSALSILNVCDICCTVAIRERVDRIPRVRLAAI